MKKLYIDIRFAKCILALTAGWLMAGCSAEDELGNGSAAQQLSITPMINDLQTTRVKEEENLHEKTLSSLDFKMFGPTNNGDCRINCQFTSPAENQAKVLASGDWKSEHHLDVDKTYPYYAVANAKEDLKGKNLKDLLASTQQDDDIWKPATMVNDKKFLMSSQDEYTITQDPEQDIPVKLVRAAAKIKLNISSTVKDYHISDVQWKLINYNTNTTIFAGADQTATPPIISDNNTWSPAASAEDEKGNKVFTVTTYSYSTKWETQETMPQIVAKVNFKYKDDPKKDTLKVLNIPVRDPQGDKRLDRNYIYTVNAVIKYLDTNTHIDYDGDTGYLKWQIAKWTQGEDTYVKGDKASFLVVYPTQLDLKDPMDWGTANQCIDWFASCPIFQQPEKEGYYFDKYGKKIVDNNLAGQIISQSDKSVSDDNRGKIDIHGNKPEYTINYINFLVKTNDGSKSQKVNVRKYPAIYSLNVANAEASDKQNTQNRLYTLQFTTNQGIGGYTIAKPQLDSEKKSTDKTVSPALIMASARHSNETAGSNEEARKYCQSYSEKATTLKGETLNMHGWRLPTTDEVTLINQLANNNNVVDSQILSNAYYWTLDGTKAAFNGAGNSTYVRCVHDLTLEEIEKIENQGFE
uniref:fimbrial tip adhesin FimD n=1 Tax=Prevotella sp. TaxID=59823 RepID=UPI003FEFEA0C